MIFSKILFLTKLYRNTFALFALGIVLLLICAKYQARSPFMSIEPWIAYSIVIVSTASIAIELAYSWKIQGIARLVISLGMSSDSTKNGQQSKRVPKLKWRKNRSELLVGNLSQGVSLSVAESLQIPLANHLKLPVVKVFHEPESRAFVFQIDRCPKNLPLSIIANQVWKDRPHCGLIGNGIDNSPIPIDFSRAPILDVRASTGSGKTEACVAISASMILNDPRICREVIIVDPKSTDESKASAQYEVLVKLCEAMNIPVRVINPDESEIEIDEDGKIVRDVPIGLMKVRESFARIHREYQKLPSKTSPPDFYFLKICDEASSYLDPTSHSSKDKRAICLELCSYVNLWGRLFRSVSWGLISICQSPKSDAIAIDQTNLLYRLLGHCGTSQMSINLCGDDRLYRDPSYTRGKFHLVAIPEGYQGPVRTAFGGMSMEEVRKRSKKRRGVDRDAP